MPALDINALYDRVRHHHVYDCNKHDLAPDAEAYATEKIDAMTPNELLQAISWALPDVLKEHGL